MSVVRASIHIPAAPGKVWELVMDPARLGQWVTIHRKLLHADTGSPRKGFQMEQVLHLRGVNIDVHWKLIECRPHELAVWQGRGPARSRARTEYKITSEGDGTRFDYRNEFHAPLGFLGALASRALVGGMPEREAKLTLTRLQALLEQPTALSRSNGAE
jgi:uncharacterized protein YndB with AHSA1/START domain